LLLRSVHRTNAGERCWGQDEKKIKWPSDEVGQIVDDVLLGEFLSILVLSKEASEDRPTKPTERRIQRGTRGQQELTSVFLIVLVSSYPILQTSA
jgi:hypothetical protein